MSKSTRFDKSRLKCFICKIKTCHFKKDCPKREENEDFVQVEVALDEYSYSCRVWKLKRVGSWTQAKFVVDMHVS